MDPTVYIYTYTQVHFKEKKKLHSALIVLKDFDIDSELQKCPNFGIYYARMYVHTYIAIN